VKVLVFGGSFDPPHRGHEALLRAAIERLKPARVLIVPAWLSPFKEDHGAPPAVRAALARAFAKKFPRTSIDLFELRRRRRAYTYELLAEVRRRHPGAEPWVLIGSDLLAQLPEWRRPAALRRASWLVGLRPGAKLRAPHGFRVTPLAGRFPDVSSTEVRARLYCGRPWKRFVPKRVARLIKKRGLYGLAWREELSRTLSKDRLHHTLSVARLAAELARRHGEDASAAALAGLLHDCGRRFDMAGMARYARRNRLPVPARERTLAQAPLLAHAYVGADLARRRFGVTAPRTLAAIAHHTLGRPGMGRLERLLYVADTASEDRGFAGASAIRRLARRDLDGAFLAAARAKLRFVREQGRWEHPMGKRTLRFAERLRP
jgi:nicotinate-nucleotide adenylyltransferase